MMVNKHLPHVLVLPEDRANSQMATGFQGEVDLFRQKQMQVLEEAGGWKKVLDCFLSDQSGYMKRYPNRFMVLLIDFDNQPERLKEAKAVIPPELADRVFILGTLDEPEVLKRSLFGSEVLKRSLLDPYEAIGSGLASECREETYTIQGWDHDLLKHNKSELDRLREHVRSILF